MTKASSAMLEKQRYAIFRIPTGGIEPALHEGTTTVRLDMSSQKFTLL